ncbi:MAG TPA: hypothetical protein VG186_08390 [Solirubrobacteraceae bacterium]|nr:hypothetical protein [Solirubrobacteraceae bacterium]
MTTVWVVNRRHVTISDGAARRGTARHDVARHGTDGTDGATARRRDGRRRGACGAVLAAPLRTAAAPVIASREINTLHPLTDLGG